MTKEMHDLLDIVESVENRWERNYLRMAIHIAYKEGGKTDISYKEVVFKILERNSETITDDDLKTIFTNK